VRINNLAGTVIIFVLFIVAPTQEKQDYRNTPLAPAVNGSVTTFVNTRGLVKVVVFLWGSMNSWFLYEFTVCSMESILANIADNLLNIDYAMSIMVLGSGITVTGS
jgi:hypothetical protein